MQCARGSMVTMFLMAGLAGGVCADEALRLRPLEAPVRLLLVKDETLTSNGKETSTKHEEITLSVRVEAGEGDALKLSLSFERMVLEEKRGERTRKVDTAAPEAKGRPEMQMIGQPIVAIVDARGALKELVSIMGKPASEAPEAEREQLKEMFFDGMVGNAGLALLVPFGESAAPGSTWKVEQGVMLPGLGRLALIVDNTVEAADDATVTVKQKGAATAPGKDGGPGVESMTLGAKLVVSKKDGMVLEGEMTTEMKMVMGAEEVSARSVYKRSRVE